MNRVSAINTKQTPPMLITWDLGRRCNLDCTYCEASRHNNYSKHATIDQLKKTLTFINSYVELYATHRKEKIEHTLEFTGGEPTNNPDFYDFIKYVKESTDYRVGLTTNGTWPEIRCNDIHRYTDGVTISWHAEADSTIRNRALQNALTLHKTGMWIQVNIMLHVDYFDACKRAIEFCEKHHIHYNPVPIGDGTTKRSGWFTDEDGKQRRTSHAYTEEQKAWFYSKFNVDPSVGKEGTELGRKCCGGRCLLGKKETGWEEVSLVENMFTDWHCSVNWWFVHIDQETGNVYHHQTCQATWEGKGTIGNLNNTDAILKYTLERIKVNIKCPNQRCGCGTCVFKAKDKKDFDVMWRQHVIS